MAALALVPKGAFCQRPSAEMPKPRDVTVDIDTFRNILWQPEDNYFLSPGPVRLTLTMHDPEELIILTADDAEGRPEGEITVRGGFTLRRRDALIRGMSLRLNAADVTGSLKSAEAFVGPLIVHAQNLSLDRNQSFTAHHARFTTCGSKHPHFCIHAQELRLNSQRKVIARNIALEVGGRRLLVWPTFERTFTDRVENPLPVPTYSKETGLKIHLGGETWSSSRSALRYEVVPSVLRSPYGSVAYETALGKVRQEAQPPALRQYAPEERTLDVAQLFPLSGRPPIAYQDHHTVLALALGVDEYYRNGRLYRTRVSRLPEVGVVSYRPGRIPRDWRHADPGASYYWGVFAGRYREEPSEADESALRARLGAVTPGLSLAPAVLLRAGVDVDANLYGKGNGYSIVSPVAELAWRSPGGTTLSAAYRYRRQSGSTPFLFDRLDVERELRLQYDGDYRRWGLGFGLVYDTERWRAYDTSMSIVHKLDCMEFGLRYSARSQSLGIVFNLLPGSPQPERIKEASVP